MFVTLHIKTSREKNLEITETSAVVGGSKTTFVEFDRFGEPEYISQDDLVWVHLNDDDNWIIHHGDQVGSGMLITDEVLPLTCVATVDSIEYTFRDVEYKGTSITP